MSVSTRGRRGMVYVYSAADDGGYVTQRYTLLGTYFVRINIAAASERTQADQAEHDEKALFEFGDAVSIGMNDLIVENNTQWKVESVITRRGARAKVVRAFRVDDDIYLRLVQYNGELLFDGVNTFSGYVSALT